jgi:hypothetical protein
LLDILFKLTTTTENLLPNTLVLAVSAHLIAEAARRLFFVSDIAYLVADVIVLSLAVVAIRLGGFRLDNRIAVFFWLYVVAGVFGHLRGEHSLFLIAVGLRPLILGLALYAIAENAFRVNPDTTRIIKKALAFWLIVITGLAIYQIDAGASASINEIPGVKFGGRGDPYGGIDWLFRPTSIFMHTGRFGQYSFFLALVFVLPALVVVRGNKKIWFLAMLAFLAVLISGQRSSFVMLLLTCVCALILEGKTKVFLRMVLGISLLSILIAVMNPDVLLAFSDRMASGFTDAGQRVAEQGGALAGMARYPLMGEGLGFFSLGGERFGGQSYFSYMSEFGGGGENSWLSIQGETGTLGVMFYALALLFIVSKSFRNFRKASSFGATDVSWHLAAAFIPLAVSMWALTHNVFSNYLQMIAIFFLFGASVGTLSNLRASRETATHFKNSPVEKIFLKTSVPPSSAGNSYSSDSISSERSFL